ncbi:MAG: hypothetical protein CVT70_12310, partial [Alphaproteobacteria bacterium HGW-Alphaproteobacteria-1]
EHEFSGGGCRIDPLLEADQIDLSGFEAVDGFQEFLERAPQPIKADNGEGIVGPGLIKQGRQTGPVERLAGDHALIEGLSCGQFLADRAFDANWLREALAEAGIEAVIPPKSNRKFPAEFDRATYKWRHLIENLFGKLKEYRGIATRCCKTDSSFSAFIAIAATVIRLR